MGRWGWLIFLAALVGCHKVRNQLNQQVLQCGPEARHASGRLIQVYQPDGTRLEDPDMLLAFQLDLSEGADDPRVFLPTTSRSCIMVPDQADRQDIYLTTRYEDRQWFARIDAYPPEGLSEAHLTDVGDQSLQLSCPQTIHTNGPLALPLTAPEGADLRTWMFGVKTDPDIDLPQTLQLQGDIQGWQVQFPASSPEGDYELSIRTFNLSRAALSLGERRISCKVTLDRSPPELSTNLNEVLRDGTYKLLPGSTLTVTNNDPHSAAIETCFSAAAESCQEQSWTLTEGREVNLTAPGNGRAFLLVRGTDRAGNRSQIQSYPYSIYHQDRLEAIRAGASRATSLLETDPLKGVILGLKAYRGYLSLDLAVERRAIEDEIYNAFLNLGPTVREVYRTQIQNDVIKLKSITTPDGNSGFALGTTGGLALHTSQGALIRDLQFQGLWDVAAQGTLVWQQGDDLFTIGEGLEGQSAARRQGISEFWPQAPALTNITLSPDGHWLLLAAHTFSDTAAAEQTLEIILAERRAGIWQAVMRRSWAEGFLTGAQFNSTGSHLALEQFGQLSILATASMEWVFDQGADHQRSLFYTSASGGDHLLTLKEVWGPNGAAKEVWDLQLGLKAPLPAPQLRAVIEVVDEDSDADGPQMFVDAKLQGWLARGTKVYRFALGQEEVLKSTRDNDKAVGRLPSSAGRLFWSEVDQTLVFGEKRRLSFFKLANEGLELETHIDMGDARPSLFTALTSGHWVTTREDGNLRIWQKSGFTPDARDQHTEDIISLSPIRLNTGAPQAIMASASHDTSFRLWDRTGKAVGQPFTGHSSSVNRARSSPDGESLLSVSDDGRTLVWHPSGQVLQDLAAPFCRVSGGEEKCQPDFVALDERGERLVQAGTYSPSGTGQVQFFQRSAEDGIYSLRDPVDTDLFLGSRVWNLAEIKPLRGFAFEIMRKSGEKSLGFSDFTGQKVAASIDAIGQVAIAQEVGAVAYTQESQPGFRALQMQGGNLQALGVDDREALGEDPPTAMVWRADGKKLAALYSNRMAIFEVWQGPAGVGRLKPTLVRSIHQGDLRSRLIWPAKSPLFFMTLGNQILAYDEELNERRRFRAFTQSDESISGVISQLYVTPEADFIAASQGRALKMWPHDLGKLFDLACKHVKTYLAESRDFDFDPDLSELDRQLCDLDRTFVHGVDF